VIIARSQLEEAARWVHWWLKGKCTLEDALCGVLRSGAPAPAVLVDAVTAAFDNYTTGAFLNGEKKPKDLAECFGSVKAGNTAQKIAARIRKSDVYRYVEALHADHPDLGYELSDTVGRETLFSRAAPGLGLTEGMVSRHYYGSEEYMARGARRPPARKKLARE
jgi:hypothetical protein